MPPYLDQEELVTPLTEVLLVNTSKTNPFLGFNTKALLFTFNSICLAVKPNAC